MTPYQLGIATALAKLGSQHVAVLDGDDPGAQTYQYRPDPAYINDTRLAGRNIDATWQSHDRRMQQQGRDFPLVGS